MQYVLLQKHVYFSPVAVRLIKHRPVPGWASADLLRDLLMFLALVRHRTMSGRALLESYDNFFKQKLSGARPMCANAGRAPAEHRFTLNNPTNAVWAP